MQKQLFLILGLFFLFLTFIGILLPLIPATPFALLAAFFLQKGSPRLHQKLHEIPYLGESLKDWEQSKVIRPRFKIIASFFILTTLTYSLLKNGIPIWGRLLMLTTAVAVLIFILSRKNSPSA